MKIIIIIILLIPCLSQAQTKSCSDGYSYGGGDDFYSHSRYNKLVNDSCVTIVEFKKKVNGKWVDISECQYYLETKVVCFETSENGRKKIPCCGHVHKENPSKEIKQ